MRMMSYELIQEEYRQMENTFKKCILNKEDWKHDQEPDHKQLSYNMIRILSVAEIH